MSRYQQGFRSVVAPGNPLAETPNPLQQLPGVLAPRGGKPVVSRTDQLREDPGIFLLGLPDRESLPTPVVELAEISVCVDREPAAPDQDLGAFRRASEVTGVDRRKAVPGEPFCKQRDLPPSGVS